jgi:hypothetical protein
MTALSPSRKFAKDLLSNQASGPCVMLAYTWANAMERRSKKLGRGSFSYNMPVMNKESKAEAVPNYAVIKTDRTGHEIYSLPGGGQDILFFRRGIYQSVELGKRSLQADYLRGVLGVDAPKKLNDERFIDLLAQQSDITNITLETAFNAALREGQEEHGWSYATNRNKIVSEPIEVEHRAILKRSFDFNPPRPVAMQVGLVAVESFENTVPWLERKVEGKMKGRKGRRFFEQGDFASLDDLKGDLAELKWSLSKGKIRGKLFDQQVVSTQSRVDMIEKFEAEHIYPQRARNLAL